MYVRYRFQNDGRLKRSLETGKASLVAYAHCLNNLLAAVMLMETFDRITRPDKYIWDVSRPRYVPEAETYLQCLIDIWSRQFS